jgi:cell wall-associated NlpC family hydrolase
MVFAIPATATDHLVEGEVAAVSGTNGYGLNIRTEPSTSSDVHFVAPEGTIMQITGGLNESGGLSWYPVHVDGVDAWVMADFISGYSSSAGDQVEVVKTDGHGLRLRADASSSSDTLTVLPEGTVANVVGDERVDDAGTTWVNVDYNGTVGYSHRGYLAVISVGGQDVQATDPDEHSESEPSEIEEAPEEGEQSNPDEAVQEDPEPEPEPEPEPAPEPDNSSGIAVGGNVEVVNTSGYGLNIRHGAGFGNSVLTVAAEGHVAHVLGGPEIDGEGTSWWNVDYRGHNGWAHGGYLQATDAEPTGQGSGSGQSSNDNGSSAPEAPAASPMGQQIVNEAMRFLGYPYVWGGTTPAGFDCSGFLYYVVNQVAGNNFPRLMEAQVNRGTYVPSDQLQPGDLVFQQNTYQWGLSHAGIYIGNGQFIHASTPGSGVIVSNLWDSYWGQRYYTARRIS